MLKVLIADDEQKVGYLVQRLIEWERLDLELAGIVKDGRTAYQTICEENPDIVITDIRMPEIGGLELIEKVTGEGRKVHFIVISGYKYFEYAQQALRYGVEDYLLKPIDETELNQILEKICQAEQSLKSNLRRVDSLERKIHDSRQVLHREFLNQIEVWQPMNLAEVNQSYGLNFENGLFSVVCLKVDGDREAEFFETKLKLIEKRIQSFVEKELTPLVSDMALSWQSHGLLTAVINYDEGQRQAVECALEQVFGQVGDYLCSFEHCQATMGVSGGQSEFKAVAHSVEAAREAVACRLFLGPGKRIDAASISRNGSVCAEVISGAYRDKLYSAAEIARFDQMGFLIRQAFYEARDQNAFASEYYEMARQLLRDYLRSKPFGTDLEKAERISWWEACIDSCNSMVELEDFTAEAMVEDWRQTLSENQERERKPVLQAIDYIRKNYGQKLMLEELAQQSGFNMNYFSELFKKETGKTFTTYVSEVRMEEAKRLLRDTDFTVYEVAEQVGYKDSKFFSQQFSKMVGIKPVEYRKLYY